MSRSLARAGRGGCCNFQAARVAGWLPGVGESQPWQAGKWSVKYTRMKLRRLGELRRKPILLSVPLEGRRGLYLWLWILGGFICVNDEIGRTRRTRLADQSHEQILGKYGVARRVLTKTESVRSASEGLPVTPLQPSLLVASRYGGLRRGVQPPDFPGFYQRLAHPPPVRPTTLPEFQNLLENKSESSFRPTDLDPQEKHSRGRVLTEVRAHPASHIITRRLPSWFMKHLALQTALQTTFDAFPLSDGSPCEPCLGSSDVRTRESGQRQSRSREMREMTLLAAIGSRFKRISPAASSPLQSERQSTDLPSYLLFTPTYNAPSALFIAADCTSPQHPSLQIVSISKSGAGSAPAPQYFDLYRRTTQQENLEKAHRR
ncbi:hypothetical protein BJ875DRAFT_513655 [Amylocarpus encephaloides]|uniref:Uncharacterized protein n=1 Tax=Amylocarpus encephaloides TaxID=45428 RepID=A0A9P7YFJ3_9HELO|nr:hypothetical protein BJ875DRAFT_513655 [Amylocarpus encephaloides]